MNEDQHKQQEYDETLSQVALTVQSFMKHDGWQIFIALWEKEKKDLRERSDYESLEAFKGDRKAIDIFDGIVDKFTQYILDATDAVELSNQLKLAQSQTPTKGALMIDIIEEGREG